jgi:hypothetical protein
MTSSSAERGRRSGSESGWFTARRLKSAISSWRSSVRGTDILVASVFVALSLGLGAYIFARAQAAAHLAFTEKAQRLRARGVRVHTVGLRDGHVDLEAVLGKLGELHFTHLLVEPGPRLARTMLQQNLADRVWVIHSPQALAEPDAPRAPEVPYAAIARRNIEGDEILEHLNPASPVFFCPIASPEFWV